MSIKYEFIAKESGLFLRIEKDGEELLFTNVEVEAVRALADVAAIRLLRTSPDVPYEHLWVIPGMSGLEAQGLPEFIGKLEFKAAPKGLVLPEPAWKVEKARKELAERVRKTCDAVESAEKGEA